MIRLLLGGSPCTAFSIAQKNNRETQPNSGGRDYSGNIYLVAVSEDDEERYYPKYCPECGRKLHD